MLWDSHPRGQPGALGLFHHGGVHKGRAGSRFWGRFWEGEGAPVQEPSLQERCAGSSLAAAAGTSGLFSCLSAFQQGVCLHLQEAESKKSPRGHSVLSVSPGLQSSSSSLGGQCLLWQPKAPCLSGLNSLFSYPGLKKEMLWKLTSQ